MKRKVWMAWFMWALCAGFFFVEYFARVSPSVMVHELMSQYQITAVGVGSLSAFFYYAYVGMQLPVGLLVDQYGPQRLLSIMAASCALGCVIFAYANHYMLGQLARFMMGFGAAFAFVGTLKIAMMWLPRRNFGLIAALTQAIGMFGAAAGEGPLRGVVQNIGWNQTMLAIAAVLAVLSIAIAIFVKDRKADLHQTDLNNAFHQLFSSLKTVLSCRATWTNALYVGLLYAPTGAFGELWGVSYLHQSNHISQQHAAAAISMLFVGIGVCGPFVGWLSDHLNRRVIIMRASAIISLLVMLILLYVPMHGAWLLLLAFCYGAANTGLSVSYAFASELKPAKFGGTAVAFANMASVIIAGFLQPVLGLMLDLFWRGQMLGAARVYDTYDYHRAMVILPCCLLAAFFISFLLHDRMRDHGAIHA